MAEEPRRLAVSAGSELAALLDEAARAPVLLEKGGVVFRLAPATRADYNPQAAFGAMNRAAGGWKDVDPEAFKAAVYRAREEGTRPAPGV